MLSRYLFSLWHKGEGDGQIQSEEAQAVDNEDIEDIEDNAVNDALDAIEEMNEQIEFLEAEQLATEQLATEQFAAEQLEAELAAELLETGQVDSEVVSNAEMPAEEKKEEDLDTQLAAAFNEKAATAALDSECELEPAPFSIGRLIITVHTLCPLELAARMASPPVSNDKTQKPNVKNILKKLFKCPVSISKQLLLLTAISGTNPNLHCFVIDEQYHVGSCYITKEEQKLIERQHENIGYSLVLCSECIDCHDVIRNQNIQKTLFRICKNRLTTPRTVWYHGAKMMMQFHEKSKRAYHQPRPTVLTKSSSKDEEYKDYYSPRFKPDSWPKPHRMNFQQLRRKKIIPSGNKNRSHNKNHSFKKSNKAVNRENTFMTVSAAIYSKKRVISTGAVMGADEPATSCYEFPPIENPNLATKPPKAKYNMRVLLEPAPFWESMSCVPAAVEAASVANFTDEETVLNADSQEFDKLLGPLEMPKHFSQRAKQLMDNKLRNLTARNTYYKFDEAVTKINRHNKPKSKYLLRFFKLAELLDLQMFIRVDGKTTEPQNSELCFYRIECYMFADRNDLLASLCLSRALFERFVRKFPHIQANMSHVDNAFELTGTPNIVTNCLRTVMARPLFNILAEMTFNVLQKKPAIKEITLEKQIQVMQEILVTKRKQLNSMPLNLNTFKY